MSDTGDSYSKMKVEYTPYLEGELVVLRPFSEENITPEYINWLNDPEIVLYSEQRHKTHTLDSCFEYFHRMKSQQHHFWAIFEKNKVEKHIGNITAYVDRNNEVADLAIMIGDKGSQKKGFGKDAWLVASNFLLGLAKIRKITAGTMSKNAAMLNIMRKTGMIQEGLRQKHFLLKGEEVDLIMAARFKE